MAGDVWMQWVAVTPQLVAALVLLALAGVLVAVARRSLVAWAFAFLLTVRAGLLVVSRWSILTSTGGALDDPHVFAALGAVLPFLRVAVAPAVAYFVVTYHRPAAGGRWRAWRIALPLVAVAAELTLLVLATDGTTCATDCAGAAAGTFQAGPMRVFDGLADAATGLAALSFARSASRRPLGALHSAAFLLSTGFALTALLDGGNVVLEMLRGAGPSGYLAGYVSGQEWIVASLAFSCLGFAAALSAFGWFAYDARRDGDLWPATIAAYGAAAWVLATSAFIVFTPDQSPRGSFVQPAALLAYFAVGLWRLLPAVLAALALLKHRLFGVQVGSNRALARSAIVGAFLAVFFVVAQVVQNLATNSSSHLFGDDRDAYVGIVGGGAAAGLLLLLLHPLRDAGHRVADALLPAAPQRGTFDADEAAALYRDQAMLVWADGVMGRKERHLLDQLRVRLGLTFAQAAEIERLAAREAPDGNLPVRTSTRAARRNAGSPAK